MSEACPAVQEEPVVPRLFGMGERRGEQREYWVPALLLALLVQAGSVGVWLKASAKDAVPPERAAEPELVFFSFPPPPPAASRTASASAVHRPMRARPPSATILKRPSPVQRPLEPPAEPVPPPEQTPPEAPPEASEDAAVEQEAASIDGVSGVIGGLVGGAVGGREGGMVGGTGGTALELKQVTRAPRVLEQIQPLYPKRARAEGIVGLVRVRLIIGVDGRVEAENTRVLQSIPELDAAAIAAVDQWRFTPALGQQGRPVRVIVEIPIQFSLK